MFKFKTGCEYTHKWDDSPSGKKRSLDKATSSLLMRGEVWCMGARGSVGYRAKNSSNEVGFVTAGHFGKVYIAISLANGTEVGYTDQSVYGGLDAAFVYLYPQYEITSTTTAYSMNSIITTMPIVLIENNGVGKDGATTFYSTGKVLATGRRVTSDGVTVNNVTVTDYDSAAGDSGGIVYDTTFHRLAGIHQGSSTTSAQRYYVVENDVRNTLGVTPY